MNSQQHRVLVVGTGSIGERHVRCYLATGRAHVGICESNASRRAEIAQRYNLADQFEDLETALAQPWDAVLIATPAHTHIPIATQVAKLGLNLIIEKPLATSLEGIEELQKHIAASRTKCAVSYQLRAHPAAREMKAAIDSQEFGRPLQIYATSGQSFPFYRPAYRDTYFADRRTGGGAIQDAITHMWNLSEWLVGPMTRLCVDASHQQLEGVTVEDTVHVLARHGAVLGSYSMNMYQHPNESQVTVVCEQGTLRFEVHQSRWRYQTSPEESWHDQQHTLEDRDAWYIENASVLLDVLEDKVPPLCSLEDALQTLKVNLAALKSADSQSWQDIN